MTRAWGLVMLAMLVGCGGAASASPKPADPPRVVPPPPPPSCLAIADHMLDLLEPKDAHARALRDIFLSRCEADGWAADARRCIAETTSLKDPKHCKARLTTVQREALDNQLATVDNENWPPACVRYRKVIEQMAACDALPQQSRDAVRQGFDAMSESWKNLGDLPEEARTAMADACAQAAEALEQALGSMCAP